MLSSDVCGTKRQFTYTFAWKKIYIYISPTHYIFTSVLLLPYDFIFIIQVFNHCVYLKNCISLYYYAWFSLRDERYNI